MWEFEILADDRFEKNFRGRSQTWFRMDCNMVHSAKWGKISVASRCLWIHLVACGASKGSRYVQLTEKQLTMAVRTKPFRLPAVVQELIDNEWIRVVSNFDQNKNSPSKERKKERRALSCITPTEISTDPPKLEPPESFAESPSPQTATSATAAIPPKKLSGPIHVEKPEDLKGVINPQRIAIWRELYPDAEFITRTTLKALNYYNTNPLKKPKSARGWTQALSYWFDRDWVKHQRNIPVKGGRSV